MEVLRFAENSLKRKMKMGGTEKHQRSLADLSQCNTYLCRACSIQIDSWRPPFLLHKDGFPPFSAPGWLDMSTFHVVIFPNWWLNDFFPLSIIISWRNEAKLYPPREGNFGFLLAPDSVLHSRCTFMRHFKTHWFGKNVQCKYKMSSWTSTRVLQLSCNTPLLVMSEEFRI